MRTRTLFHNPALLRPDELAAGFLVRGELLERLGERLGRFAAGRQASHVHVLGAWGMGRSMLLARLALLCHERRELRRLTPVLLGEELTRAGELPDLWLEVGRELARSLELPELWADAEGLRDAEQDAGRLVDGLERLVRQALERTGRRLLLLIDGWDRLLETASDPRVRRRLRNGLGSNGNVSVVAASTLPDAALRTASDPLAGSFEPVELPPLSADEVRTLLAGLAATAGDDRLLERLDRQPGRLAGILRVAQGTPRLAALWWPLLQRAPFGSLADDLDGLVDALSPYHRLAVETLPRQARRVLSTLALRWSPMHARELSTPLRLGRNHVAAQISRLRKDGWVAEVAVDGARRAYRLASRPLNLHLLLRGGHPTRRRLRLWASFLEALHGGGGGRSGTPVRPPTELPPPDINGRARRRSPARVSSPPLGGRRAEAFWRLLADLPEAGPPGTGTPPERYAALRHGVRTARVHAESWDAEAFSWLLCGSANLSLEEKERVAAALETAPLDWLHDLSEALRDEAREFSELLGPSIWDAWTRATASGRLGPSPRLRSQCRALVESIVAAGRIWMADALLLGLLATEEPDLMSLVDPMAEGLGEDVEAVREKLVDAWTARLRHSGLGPRFWTNLGDLLRDRLGLHDEAEQALRRAVELDPRHAAANNELGNLLADHRGDDAGAEEAFRRAAQASPDLAAPWHNLGDLLARQPGRAEEAEAAYRRALELAPEEPATWDHLGDLLARSMGRLEEAEEACRKALELAPDRAATLDHLGDLLAEQPERLEEAEDAYRGATAADPTWARPWDGLGALLHQRLGRPAEAEDAYRKALALDPAWPRPWGNVAALLHHRQGRPREAEDAYRRALELSPGWAWAWAGLGALLEHRRGLFAEAEEAYRRAVELDPDWARPHHDLGRLLHRHLARPEEAEVAYRAAIYRCPEDPAPWLDLGELLRDILDHAEEAEEALRRAVAADGGPESKDALARHLLRHDGLSGLPEALELARAAVAQAPSSPDARRTVVEVLVVMDRWTEARLELEALLSVADLEHLSRWGREAVLLLCRLARRARVEDLLELLESTPLADWWRPVALALAAREAGGEAPLQAAPEELAEAARDVLPLLDTHA